MPFIESFTVESIESVAIPCAVIAPPDVDAYCCSFCEVIATAIEPVVTAVVHDHLLLLMLMHIAAPFVKSLLPPLKQLLRCCS